MNDNLTHGLVLGGAAPANSADAPGGAAPGNLLQVLQVPAPGTCSRWSCSRWPAPGTGSSKNLGWHPQVSTITDKSTRPKTQFLTLTTVWRSEHLENTRRTAIWPSERLYLYPTTGLRLQPSRSWLRILCPSVIGQCRCDGPIRRETRAAMRQHETSF